MPTAPVNYRKQTNTPQAIVNATDYAIRVLDGYRMWWSCYGPSRDARSERPFEGLTLLEIGPGPSLGSAVLLAGAGATVSIADRFTPEWDPDFHGPFYTELLRKAEPRGEAFAAPIRRLLEAGGFAPDVITCHPVAAEELSRIGTCFDVVLSNAVLEHVESLEATTKNLAAVTAPGGYGFHQIDLRDHRDFERPLEFLTLPARRFARLRHESFCECGGAWRMPDVKTAFEKAGFDITHAIPNLFATPDYMADLRPRLQPEYQRYSDADLAAISALFVVTLTL